MAVSGFPLLLAAVAALAGLMAVAFPARGEEGPARQPAVAARLADVPDDELSEAARPSETPPPDFTAAQYIDSSGCVFLRTGRGWRARIARDGTPICGYPPTLSARRTDPERAVALFPGPEEPAGQRISRELTEAIVPNLRTGELVAGGEGIHRMDGEAGTGGRSRPDSSSGADEVSDQSADDSLRLGEMLAGAPELSRQMTRGRASVRLCALLGATPQDPVGSTLGLCGGSAKPLGTVTSNAPGAHDQAGTARAATADNARQTRSRTSAGSSGMIAKPQPTSRTAQAMAELRDNGRMIPPGARYVQVGTFRDPGETERVAQQLAALGLPVVRSRRAEGQAQLVLVGPLDGREAIVRMIDRLRRAGYRDVIARR